MSYQANTQYGQPQQPTNLPVPTDRYDQNTFNPNLPNQNDVTPPVNQPPNLDGRIMDRIAAEFRFAAQQRVNRTPLHMFTYNMWSQNYFQNQEYVTWLQRAMDFTEFLIVARSYQPEQAVQKAVQLIYAGAMAMYTAQYPTLQGLLTHQQRNEIPQFGQELESIIRDIQQFHANGRRPTQMQWGQQGQQAQYGGTYQQPIQQGGGVQQLPPTHLNPHFPNQSVGYGQPQGQPMPQQAPLQGPAGYGSGPQGQPNPVTSTNSPSAGRYIDLDNRPNQAQPTPQGGPSQQTWMASQTPASPVGGITPPSFNNGNGTPQPSASLLSAYDEQTQGTSQSVPNCVEDINLSDYVDENASERPWDVIHIPGGIEVRPAHLTDWKRTRRDEKPYAVAYDPQRFILFYVKWPDGIVDELIVEKSTMKTMNYLQHEIDAKLRGEKIKPEGKVVASHHKVLDMDVEAQVKPVEEVRKALDEGLASKDALNPVQLDGYFTATSELENEEEVRLQVMEQLGLEENAKVPAHEYTSAQVFPINVPQEGKDRLQAMATSDSLKRLATALVEAVNDGAISQRYFLFFNRRMTDAVNATLKDNLSLDIDIDSFVEDIDDLFDYLRENHGDNLSTILHAQTQNILTRWLNFKEEVDGEEKTLYLLDEAMNFQLPWEYKDLASLTLSDEPVVVSGVTHPTIANVLRQTFKRHAKTGNLKGRRLRLITVDGHYLEAFRGWLMEDSILIKRL